MSQKDGGLEAPTVSLLSAKTRGEAKSNSSALAPGISYIHETLICWLLFYIHLHFTAAADDLCCDIR